MLWGLKGWYQSKEGGNTCTRCNTPQQLSLPWWTCGAVICEHYLGEPLKLESLPAPPWSTRGCKCWGQRGRRWRWWQETRRHFRLWRARTGASSQWCRRGFGTGAWLSGRQRTAQSAQTGPTLRHVAASRWSSSWSPTGLSKNAESWWLGGNSLTNNLKSTNLWRYWGHCLTYDERRWEGVQHADDQDPRAEAKEEQVYESKLGSHCIDLFLNGHHGPEPRGQGLDRWEDGRDERKRVQIDHRSVDVGKLPDSGVWVVGMVGGQICWKTVILTKKYWPHFCVRWLRTTYQLHKPPHNPTMFKM